MKYLGFIIGIDGCAPDPDMISTVVEWANNLEYDSANGQRRESVGGYHRQWNGSDSRFSPVSSSSV